MKHGILQNSEQLQKRKALRKKQTIHETLLWSRLRGGKMDGCKFIRQYSIGKYIVDFYCPKYQLGIEVDGGQHDEEAAQRYDQERTQFITSQGIRIIRFWNNEICNQIDGVCDKILETLKTQAPKF